MANLFENVITDSVIVKDRDVIRHILESSGYMFNFIGIRKYQKDNGLKPTGTLNLETANHIKDRHSGYVERNSFKVFDQDHIKNPNNTFSKENIEV